MSEDEEWYLAIYNKISDVIEALSELRTYCREQLGALADKADLDRANRNMK